MASVGAGTNSNWRQDARVMAGRWDQPAKLMVDDGGAVMLAVDLRRHTNAQMRLGEEMRMNLGLRVNRHLELEGVESESQRGVLDATTYSALML